MRIVLRCRCAQLKDPASKNAKGKEGENEVPREILSRRGLILELISTNPEVEGMLPLSFLFRDFLATACSKAGANFKKIAASDVVSAFPIVSSSLVTPFSRYTDPSVRIVNVRACRV